MRTSSKMLMSRTLALQYLNRIQAYQITYLLELNNVRYNPVYIQNRERQFWLRNYLAEVAVIGTREAENF
jgi:hypothetical protein